ncbi:hypothetical protein LCGC14_0672550 [marine sediment metagenome]|uniref:Bacteriophage Mu GpT domain-containing protein n=1 Tax=marine sediment metagenome TaxID=412755 RepID=A0A0F9QQL2_9ZZZZ
MGIAFESIADAVLVTQEKLVKRGAFVDLQTDYQDHVAVRNMWKQRQKKFEGGDTWDFQAQMDHNHSAKAVALYQTDNSADTDNLVTGSIRAKHVNAHYIYDLRLPDFQRGGTKIVDLVKAKYVEMMVSFYEKMEEYLWGTPTTSTDLITPFGIEYWVTKSGSSDGFNGGNPSGFSAGKAGISQGTYARWANWTGRYVAITKSDLIRRMREAHTKTNFRAIVDHATPIVGSGRGIYAPYSVLGIMEEELEKQNMNLGNDMASKDGKTVFRGTPITWVPYLDRAAVTDAPVYMLNWKHLVVGIMAGWESNLTPPYRVADMHNVRRVDLDVSFNMLCTNLRNQAVINTAG